MESKIVLITGASSGFGYETASHLSELGYKVYGTSRSRPHKNINFKYLPIDVTSIPSIENGVKHIVSQEGRIDILINNAGFILSGSIEETDIDEAKSVMETNFFGVVSVTNMVLPIMRHQGGGQIINISSAAGVLAIPNLGFYSASKFALEGYSETLSLETSKFNIKVSVVEPAIFKTNIGRSKLMAKKKIKEYDSMRRSVKMALKRAYDNGGEPKHLAKLVSKIINDKQPKLRYRIGPNSLLVAFLRKFMPDQVNSWAMKKYFNT